MHPLTVVCVCLLDQPAHILAPAAALLTASSWSTNNFLQTRFSVGAAVKRASVHKWSWLIRGQFPQALALLLH